MSLVTLPLKTSEDFWLEKNQSHEMCQTGKGHIEHKEM